jgi:hypothetical protein
MSQKTPDKKRLNPALLALTASALGLPGMAKAQAPEELQLDYRYSAYREDDLPGSKLAGGDRERYEIDTHQFRVASPLDSEFELAAELTYESMSGASPWFIQPVNGEPMQVMSGATIEETRTDLLLSATRKLGLGKGTVSLGYSDEDDYKAINFGAQGEWQLADTVSTLSAGIGYSDDELDPTDAGTTKFPKRVQHAERDSLSVFGGYARVLDANTVIQTSLSFTEHDGFLSDPYKEAWIVSLGNTAADSRPDGRRQWAWLTRLRRYFAGPDAALHADYRLYDDDWDVTAHTIDLAWHQNFAGGLKVVPGLRWYSQSQAFFYEPFYATPRNDGFASSDYRLSPFGALSLSLGVSKDFNGWALGLRYENYNSGDNYAADDVDVENPGLVDFNILSFSVRKTF